MPRLLQLLNRHGTSLGLFLMLLGLCAVFHSLAIGRIELAPEVFAKAEPRWTVRVALIHLVDAQAWTYALLYAAVVLPGLFWLEVLSKSRRVIFCAVTILGLPCLGYVWVCARIATEPIHLGIIGW